MSPRFSAAKSDAAPYRFVVYLACTVFALSLNYLLGKDMPPDTLQYHIYAGFNAVHDRFDQDYFPAGPNAYFNPYIYLPLYGLISSNLSSLEISSILAITHSILLWLTYELALVVCPLQDRRERLKFGLCALAFTLVNPILLQQIGSTLADITTAVLVLAGWLFLARTVRAPSLGRTICAGLLCGLAAGLKLTNAVHAIAGIGVLMLLPTSLWERVRHGIAYGVALGISVFVVLAPWSCRLQGRFGNPLFPLMNSVFKSPEMTTQGARTMRFIPETAGEFLWRPFAMIDPVTMVHVEMSAPDPRYALLLIVTGIYFCRWLWVRRLAPASHPDACDDAHPARVLAAIGFGLALDWVLWLDGSGNSRYFLPMSSVAGVVLVALLYRLLARAKARNYLIACILGTQCVQLWMAADYRWNGTAWDDHWINVQVPQRLRSERNLFFSIGAQSNSFVAPYLAADSGLINISGLYILGPDGANGARIAALIKRYAPNLRMLIPGERIYAAGEHRAPTRVQIDEALAPFSLRVDEGDCATISVRGLPPPLEFVPAGSKSPAPRPHDTSYLLSCAVVRDDTDHSAQIPLHRSADLALDHLEDACPALFQPRRLRTEYIGDGGLRHYVATDLNAWVSHGSVKFRQPSVGGDIVFLGSESDWVRAPLELRCGRRNGRYFAILPSPPPTP
jgi:hypothetical protein